ncbi:hypothetical protein C8F01DRAFT_303493 [Mycena amicta]|nr:hypothetical protein C8F01DRAFT_303493 [Mycena amicta]
MYFLRPQKTSSSSISPSNLPAPEFRKNSRKIIRLIETARETLQASGILLHLFTSCSARRQERKEVYFDLLRMLKERRDDVDPALQARMNALLVRLSSNFRVRRLGVQQEPSSSAGDWMVTCRTQPPGLPRAPAPVVNSRTSSLAPTITTRPPDAAPSKPSPFPGSETSASICSTMPRK